MRIGKSNGTSARLSRRALLTTALAGAATLSINRSALAAAGAKPMAPAEPLKPLQIVVSLDAQRLDAFRGTERITSSPISSGKSGHGTPTGIFSVLEKRRRHFSNLYNNAPMPYMQRLTWSGIALHEGRLPGYPASHGCVRMPRDFAKSLFGKTGIGGHVIVTRGVAAPFAISHKALPQPIPEPSLLASIDNGTMSDAIDDAKLLKASLTITAVPDEEKAQEKARKRKNARPARMIIQRRSGRSLTREVQTVLTILGQTPGPIDGAMGPQTRRAIRAFQESEGLEATGKATLSLLDRMTDAAQMERTPSAHLYVRQNFRNVYNAPVHLDDPDAALGSHVFTAIDAERDSDGTVKGFDWMGVSADTSGLSAHDALDRITLPDTVRKGLEPYLDVGASLIVTDRGMSRNNTGLGTDFVVITR
ncbi:MAG: L,D-transpeptidase family protein [Pseudomonadota bacterium]